MLKLDSDEKFGPYNLFVVLLSLLAVVNIGLYFVISNEQIRYVIGAIDVLLSLFFLIEFLRNLVRAQSSVRYFFNQFGWADMLASLPLPQIKILRIFRLIGSVGVLVRIGPKNAIREVVRYWVRSAVYLLLFSLILLIEFGSIAMLITNDPSSSVHIKTFSGVIWWAYSQITAVGYQDVNLVSNSTQLIGIFVLLTGIGLISVPVSHLLKKISISRT